MSQTQVQDSVIPVATPEQIGLFKLGAARRYRERGVEPKQAAALFDRHMGKVASDIGITARPLTPATTKLAASLKAAAAKCGTPAKPKAKTKATSAKAK